MVSGLVVLRINVSIQSDMDISITQNSRSSLSKCPKPHGREGQFCQHMGKGHVIFSGILLLETSHHCQTQVTEPRAKDNASPKQNAGRTHHTWSLPLYLESNSATLKGGGMLMAGMAMGGIGCSEHSSLGQEGSMSLCFSQGFTGPVRLGGDSLPRQCIRTCGKQ